MKNRLNELRAEKKITQEILAKNLGVSRQTIISIEQGRYVASLELAYKIAKFFNLKIEDVFLFDEEE